MVGIGLSASAASVASALVFGTGRLSTGRLLLALLIPSLTAFLAGATLGLAPARWRAVLIAALPVPVVLAITLWLVWQTRVALNGGAPVEVLAGVGWVSARDALPVGVLFGLILGVPAWMLAALLGITGGAVKRERQRRAGG